MWLHAYNGLLAGGSSSSCIITVAAARHIHKLNENPDLQVSTILVMTLTLMVALLERPISRYNELAKANHIRLFRVTIFNHLLFLMSSPASAFLFILPSMTDHGLSKGNGKSTTYMPVIL